MSFSARTLGRGLLAVVLLSVIAIVAIAGHLIETEARFQRQVSAIAVIGELTNRLSTSMGLAYAATDKYQERLFDSGEDVLSRTLGIARVNGWDRLEKLNLDALENLLNYGDAYQREANPAYISNLHLQALLQLNLMADELGQISATIHRAQFERGRQQLIYLGFLALAILVIFSLSMIVLFRGFITPIEKTAKRLLEGESAGALVQEQEGAVSELRDLIRALQELWGKLEGKNIELERVVYTVSHELKSPLVTISGFAGILASDLKEGSTDKVDYDLQQINSAVDMMSLLINDLLDLLRVGHVVFVSEKVSLDDLVRDTVHALEPQLSGSIMEFKITPDMPHVIADRLRLREVLQNLVENSVKFMGAQPTPVIEIGASVKGEEVTCFVRDNGAGINPAYHERIFGLFDRLDAGVQGTGVGLALTRRIVELNHGHIWVESEGRDKGSTFYFTVPAADQ